MGWVIGGHLCFIHGGWSPDYIRDIWARFSAWRAHPPAHVPPSYVSYVERRFLEQMDTYERVCAERGKPSALTY